MRIINITDSSNPYEVGFYNAWPGWAPDDLITLRLHLPQKTYIGFRIYDISGQQIKNFPKSHYDYGTHILTFQTNGLPAGVYFLRIDGLPGQKPIKVVILK